MGDRGGQATSGETSVSSSPTIIGGGGDKVVGVGLEQFVKMSHGILVLEGVDEDAEGADSTMRDELIMMARDDLIWMEELRRYLQQEEKESTDEGGACGEIAHWREGITVQST